MTTVAFVRDPLLTARFDITGGNDPVVLTEVFDLNDYHITGAVAGGTVVDIGANIGAFTVLAAKLGAATVHAWEPHPDNRACLEHNLALNDVGGHVTVHPEAVGGQIGTVHLAGDGAVARLDSSGQPVEAITLNDILETIDDVTFLKLDVEGAEYQIIDAVKPALLRRVGMIAGEFHPPGRLSRWGSMMAKLADYGRLETFGHPKIGGLFWVTRY
jgi:FkbM family methyltransferase